LAILPRRSLKKVNVIYNTPSSQGQSRVSQAQKLGVPFCTVRSSRYAIGGTKPLLVAGTHSKTTTSSLLAHVLNEAGLAPSIAIGGIVHSLGTNGKHGAGNYFVAEADESDGSFLKYRGFGAIITNIDNDHLDYW
jgi:UDP-N-acetylmuramate--alanine ligase